MDTFYQDFRYALRTLRKNPGFTATAVLTLALGIGANTSIFSFINAFLLRPLPFEQPDELVHVWGTNQRQGWNMNRVSQPNFLDWKDQNRVFEDMAAFNYTGETLTGLDQPEQVSGGRVSANAFQLLGVEPLMGRGFLEGEDQPGSKPVMVVSQQFWRNRLAADPKVLGRILELNDSAYTIVGVMPESFRFPLPTTQLWVPRPLDSAKYKRDVRFLQVFARLRPGVSLEQAQSEMDRLAQGLENAYPEVNAERGASVVPLRNALNFAHDIIQPMSAVLAAAVGFVLLIACANVASLLLSRARSRQREMALRTALGAARRRLVRQILTECGVIAVLGAVLGVGLAQLGTRGLAGYIPAELYKVGEIELDSNALFFTLGLALLTAFIFGIFPALRAAQVDLSDSLKEGSSGAGSGRRGRSLHSALVVAEMSLAIVLLAGTALMIRSFVNLQQVDPGFSSSDVLSLQVSLPSQRYGASAQISAFHQAVADRVAGLPGVEAAATVNYLPLNHETDSTEFSIEGRPAPQGRPWQGVAVTVSSGYFEVMQIPLLQGRVFSRQDEAGSQPVALISQAMANRFWPDSDPLGALLKLGDKGQPVMVVGVVGNVRQVDLESSSQPTIYRPQLQSPWRYLRVLARASGNPEALAAPIRREIWSLDAALPINEVRTLEQVVNDFLLPQRSLAESLGVLSAGALILAAVGIYGLMAFFVSQRVREIGIRLALGAKRSDVLRLVVGRTLKLTALGLTIGLAGAFGLTRLMSNFFFGVAAGDPSTFALTALFLTATALLAGYIPARRASRIDPMLTLRCE